MMLFVILWYLCDYDSFCLSDIFHQSKNNKRAAWHICLVYAIFEFQSIWEFGVIKIAITQLLKYRDAIYFIFCWFMYTYIVHITIALVCYIRIMVFQHSLFNHIHKNQMWSKWKYQFCTWLKFISILCQLYILSILGDS